MKIADAFYGIQRLCIDTAPFIYFVERHTNYVDRMRAIFQLLDTGLPEGVTSTITLTEILTKPIQARDKLLEKLYREFLLDTRYLQVESISIPIAERAAELRATYNLKTPDAVQFATGILFGCQALLTNDRNLSRVKDIRVLVLDDLEIGLTENPS